MNENAHRKQEGVEESDEAFRAILTPHRSLSPQGFLILMTCVGVVSFIAGAVFLYLGAWPVFGFFGLDALLIYVAFRLNYRDGRAYETIELTPKILRLTRVSAKGRIEDVEEFNPYWVRVHVAKAQDGRTMLSLTSHGRETAFGKFLSDEEREDFAEALKAALLNSRAPQF